MQDADELLHNITAKSLLALPGKKLSNIKTHHHKNRLSPCLVAPEVRCRAISRIAYHLRGFGKGKLWQNKLKQATGIRLAVDERERTVYALKWPGGKIPPEAWVGLSPTEWRLQAEDSPSTLL